MLLTKNTHFGRKVAVTEKKKNYFVKILIFLILKQFDQNDKITKHWNEGKN